MLTIFVDKFMSSYNVKVCVINQFKISVYNLWTPYQYTSAESLYSNFMNTLNYIDIPLALRADNWNKFMLRDIYNLFISFAPIYTSVNKK